MPEVIAVQSLLAGTCVLLSVPAFLALLMLDLGLSTADWKRGIYLV